MDNQHKNPYYEKAKDFKNRIINILKEIFSTSNNELQISVNEVNILQRKYNSVESSTALGFLIEEYVTQKVLNYLQNNKNLEIEYIPTKTPTQQSSYDLKFLFSDNIFLVNLKINLSKIQENGNIRKGQNNAVSAINKLYVDYVETDEHKDKHFLVIKINYQIKTSKLANNHQTIVSIDEIIDAYYLEELRLEEHKQDSRNWSKDFNKNSGRLMISDLFREMNKLQEEDINYKRTCEYIKRIVEKNKT